MRGRKGRKGGGGHLGSSSVPASPGLCTSLRTRPPSLRTRPPQVQYTCWDANPTIAAWLVAHNMTSADLQQYFWQQMAVRVLPALNRTIGVRRGR